MWVIDVMVIKKACMYKQARECVCVCACVRSRGSARAFVCVCVCVPARADSAERQGDPLFGLTF